MPLRIDTPAVSQQAKKVGNGGSKLTSMGAQDHERPLADVSSKTLKPYREH